MKIHIKTPQEIQYMKEGGKILAKILQEVAGMVKPGVTPKQLDEHARKLMKQYQVKPSFLGYHGYPAVLCINVNEEVVHGIPRDRILNEGDIVSIDGGVIHQGLHTDSAVTVGVGKISDELQTFIDTAKHALNSAIQHVKAGIFIRDISGIIQDIVEEKGYGVVRELVGHGVGRQLHEDPMVPNYREHFAGPELKVGMTLAIEPIITLGKRFIETLDDNWTIVTKDGLYAAQVEHSIVVKEDGCEILTKC